MTFATISNQILTMLETQYLVLLLMWICIPTQPFVSMYFHT